MIDKINNFKASIKKGYTCKDTSITLGCAMLNNEVITEATVCAPLKSMNRHGLIAGATGTGKTKTIQLIAEQLSEHGVPVFLMDLKGDLSGLAVAGEMNDKINSRHEKLAIPFYSTKYPIELLSLSKQPGVKLRATVSEFGPVLFSKMLGLNDTQTGVVALIFKYCDDHQLPILDLKDFKKALHYATNEGKEEITQTYGALSMTSVGAILRKIIELESQGAEKFFGEPSFDVGDLTRIDENGRGIISIIRLTDMQSRAKLFSSFMLCLLAEIYNTFPEAGDLEKPKLIMFIDEAHLIFDKASDALLEQIETIIKLIRSKGVGIFFCTQNPTDIPDAVLSQLGMKVQHALRAFTAKDRKSIKLTAENYPISEFYKTDELLTSLGIGEAAMTVLDEKGRPTPLAGVLLRAPQSRMGPLTDAEIHALTQASILINKYNQTIDRESAYELLNKKLQQSNIEEENKTTAAKAKEKDKQNLMDKLSKNVMVRQLGRAFVREITRGILGVLGIKTSTTRKKRRRY